MIKNIYEEETIINKNNLDIPNLIKQLRSKLNKIQSEYHLMLSDNNLDYKELANLLEMFNIVTNEAYSIKSIATESQDLNVISTIINYLEEEQEKIKAIQSKNESIKR